MEEDFSPQLAVFLADLEPGLVRMYYYSLWGEREFWARLLAGSGRESRRPGASRRLPRMTLPAAWRAVKAWGAGAPGSPIVPLLRAELFRKAGRLNKAQDELRKARALAPGSRCVDAVQSKLWLTRAVAGFPDRFQPTFDRFKDRAVASALRAAQDPRCLWACAVVNMTLGLQERQADAYDLLLAAAEKNPDRPELRVLLALHTFLADRTACERHLRRALALRPGWGALKAFLGELARQAGRPVEALSLFGAAMREAPGFARPYLWRAKIRRGRADWKGASADIDRALLLEPLYPWSHWERHALLLQRRNPAGALRPLARAVALESALNPAAETAAAWRFQRFEILRSLKRYRDALLPLGAAHRGNPGWAWSRGDSPPWSKSLRELDEAVRLHPRTAWLWAWRGRTRLTAGSWNEAGADLDRAVALNPREGWFSLWRAELRLRSGRPRDCLKECGRAARLGVRPPALDSIWAQGEFALGHWLAAARRARRAAEADPSQTRALITWAEALLKLRRGRLATEILRRARRLAPTDPHVLRLLSGLGDAHGDGALYDLDSLELFARKRPAVSGDRLRRERSRLASLLSRSVRTSSKVQLAASHARRGWASYLERDLGAAADALGLAIQLDPENMVYRLWRGVVRRSSGDSDQALVDFSAVIGRKPGARAAYFGRAEILIVREDWENARSDVLTLLALRPGDAAARRLMGRLERGSRRTAERT